MSVGTAELADAFEAERPRLLRVAYRLTGSVADAEDAVQEAWLRLDRAESAAIRDLPAWLTTVVSRICLDRLTSAAARRETYVGNWLPEPVVTAFPTPGHASAAPDPLDAVVADADARYAALVILEALPPNQRVAFVLHDGFGVPFADVADVLGTSPANARQLAARARAGVADPPPASDAETRLRAVEQLAAALSAGDLDAIVAVLHPDVVARGDSGGTTATALHAVRGSDKVARFFLGLLDKYGTHVITTARPVLVNGELGFLLAGSPGDATHDPIPPRVMALGVRDGRIAELYDLANPAKLRHVRLPDGTRPVPEAD
ncbi:RNA polymerase, sigma-24 subunit, ECF subfamily [Beutenbergia cavernae DSM 12333]|uniref:RNA polymerase, sigma-24 subunit, ECF subfamily n=1 Tax=Beutenbergia cavernae (strain ATCC BAA-8 / DSM 12333 / CCUG 43141 / JCM 11478 / NBRC 16432 / NCIMB 13614 / HKI 0122) TaxID=471853 RepID=C5BWK2_BEUC1|nr:sigma-70 family RNA polymerase sigma factor [Beutenbergia cavernae]ACQ78660.1 RNA polymerase, sigma-24 subunit, ECF subfamily [Beutenbergia cavernae DSM 12333]